MKNFIQPGCNLVVAMPYDRLSGQGVKVGQLFGVCTNDALNTVDNVIVTEGVFELTKAGSQAWAVGALIYWDNTNKNCTTTATANLLIGAAVEAVGSGAGETLGKVRLNGAARADGA